MLPAYLVDWGARVYVVGEKYFGVGRENERAAGCPAALVPLQEVNGLAAEADAGERAVEGAIFGVAGVDAHVHGTKEQVGAIAEADLGAALPVEKPV